MNRLLKHTSFTILILSLFTSTNTQCMEIADSNNESSDSYEVPYSETDQGKKIITALDNLFDEKGGHNAEIIIYSLTEPAERIFAAEKAYELLCTKNSVAQKKALHTFILLNPHPRHNSSEFVYAQKCVVLVQEKSNEMKAEVLRKFDDLARQISSRLQECIATNQESRALEQKDDCTCTLL